MVNAFDPNPSTDVTDLVGSNSEHKDECFQVGALKVGPTTILTPTEAAYLDTMAAAEAVNSGSATVAASTLAIPVTSRYVAKTTGGVAEALTLADGVPGQKITIALVTDGGGDGTLTPTTKSGFTSVVLADAGDNVTLEFVDATVGWVIVGTAGVAAPPVIVA